MRLGLLAKAEFCNTVFCNGAADDNKDVDAVFAADPDAEPDALDCFADDIAKKDVKSNDAHGGADEPSKVRGHEA